MPLVEVKTNVKVPNHHEFLSKLSTLAANLLDKPITGINATLEDCKSLYFGGTNAPAFTVRVKSLGSLGLEHNKEISKKLSEFLYNELGTPNDRGYIFFENPGRENCGWKGTTFAYI
ncbi:hypothetical protein Glove_423g66 [Diversispora epigaea]|uniref:L-dopachrome isomerase n=1 Tax=Diversispora epigaea TaxID=1348612 RepID=A0A397GZA0_9GLOM|nr:hypothetical protein Glove_423g66 [Diversispora epigaea]